MANTAFPWLDRAEYPFENRFLDIGGHKIHFVDEGEGEVFLFVHGTPTWSFDYRHLIRELSKDHRCVAIDHLGFGLSDKPAEGDYGLEAHVSRLETLADKLQLDRITLVVHDFGGPIGLEFALRHPDRVRRVIAFNTWMWSSEDDPQYQRLAKILRSPLLPFLYIYLNFSPKVLLPKSYANRQALTRSVHGQYLAPFAKVAERKGPLAFARSLLLDQIWFEKQWQRRSALANKPFLFIWGMKDEFVSPLYLDRFLKEFGGATFEKIENAGHFPQEEAPERVREAIKKWI